MLKSSSRAMYYAHVFANNGMSKSYALVWGWHMITLRNALRNGILRFKFTKKDGTQRIANGTLHELLIPEDKLPKGNAEKPNRTAADFKTIPFFDLEKQEWRAFSITEFGEVIEAYQIKEIMI